MNSPVRSATVCPPEQDEQSSTAGARDPLLRAMAGGLQMDLKSFFAEALEVDGAENLVPKSLFS